MTFTNVFYEETSEAAEKRLNELRKRDKYPEIKAYIIQEKDGSWRVLRRIQFSPTQPQLQMNLSKISQKRKQSKTRKAGL